MATQQRTIDYLLDQLTSEGLAASARKMFGEYGLYLDDRMVALVCDDRLFVKPTPEGLALAGPLPEHPPYPGAKPHPEVDADRWEDAAWLADLVRTTAAALPAPKPKARKKR